MKCELKLNHGLSRMRMANQPGMIIIYKTWCPVCSELKSVLGSSREIDYLSNYIVIVLLKDDDEPEDRAFAPDGAYIPRVFFLTPTGNIMYNITNSRGDPRYKYFYSAETELVPNIRRAGGQVTEDKEWRAMSAEIAGGEFFDFISFASESFKYNLWENISPGRGLIKAETEGNEYQKWKKRGLKPKFESSKEIENLSSGFVLISLADDNQPKEEKYMPDGDYVPRILFVSPQGVLLVEVINEDGSNEYKYFYSDAESIARSMKAVLKRYPDN